MTLGSGWKFQKVYINFMVPVMKSARKGAYITQLFSVKLSVVNPHYTISSNFQFALIETFYVSLIISTSKEICIEHFCYMSVITCVLFTVINSKCICIL
jgi:hypothetical protein